MSTYTAQTPPSNGTIVSPKIIRFFEDFYAISDSPSESSHAAYVNTFSEDAILMMGSKSATGRPALLELRKGLWSGPVQSRLHTVKKIFPWDKDGNEIMLYGDVLYGLKNGKEITVEWAARAVLENASSADQDIKMSFYQVYLDSAPVNNATTD